MQTRLLTLLIVATSIGLAQAPKPSIGFQQDFLLSFNDVEAKVLGLAKAIPAEKYAWRPGAGVRSVGEVYMHIANGNRLMLTLTGGMPPRDAFLKMVRDNEQREKTITDKAKVIAELEASFKEIHHALENATAGQLSKSVNFFGEDATTRGVYIAIGNHVSEHLGQSIAYARMNGIVPPWSQGQGGQ